MTRFLTNFFTKKSILLRLSSVTNRTLIYYSLISSFLETLPSVFFVVQVDSISFEPYGLSSFELEYPTPTSPRPWSIQVPSGTSGPTPQNRLGLSSYLSLSWVTDSVSSTFVSREVGINPEKLVVYNRDFVFDDRKESIKEWSKNEGPPWRISF